jgi:hypothetical protein
VLESGHAVTLPKKLYREDGGRKLLRNVGKMTHKRKAQIPKYWSYKAGIGET